MGAVRLGISALIAAGVTLALFGFMWALIASGQGPVERGDSLTGIRFEQVKPPEDPEIKDRRKPEPPPEPEDPPPPPDMPVQNMEQVTPPMPSMTMPNLELGVGAGIPFSGTLATNVDPTAEGDIIPLVRIDPQYPRRAALARIEGWVRVEFTITPAGTVSNPSVLEAKPPRVFDREAIRAILKWKFKPRVVDGQAVARQATQTIEFKLAGE